MHGAYQANSTPILETHEKAHWHRPRRKTPSHPALREKHGYAEITSELRAKMFGRNAAKVYGLSSADIKKYTARDFISRERTAYLENPGPHFKTYGPKTRREFLALFAASPSP